MATRINKLVICMSMVGLISCTAGHITHTWKSKNAIVGAYSKVMVIGLIKDSDIRVRERMEDHMVGDLKSLGYDAISSSKEYGPKAFDKMDEAAAIEKIKSTGVNAVITIVMLDRKRERYYVAGYPTFSPYGVYYDYFWGYYNTMNIRIYSGGYYQENTKYFWESNLYDMSTKELIYSVQTETFDPSNVETLGHEYGKMIIKNMVKNKVLIKKNIVPANSE